MTPGPRPDSADVDPAPSTGRRAFLGRLAALFGGAIAAVLAALGVTTFVSPAFGRRSSGWVRVGAINAGRLRRPRSMVVTFRRNDGWFAGTGQGLVHLTRDDDGNVVALSSVCTHLGCSVSYDREADGFVCPCHGGRYDAKGDVAGGPPPRPLDRLETRYEDGVLFVRGQGLDA